MRFQDDDPNDLIRRRRSMLDQLAPSPDPADLGDSPLLGQEDPSLPHQTDPANGPNGGGPWNDFPRPAGTRLEPSPTGRTLPPGGPPERPFPEPAVPVPPAPLPAGKARPHVQDPWGRSPGDPQYGMNPDPNSPDPKNFRGEPAVAPAVTAPPPSANWDANRVTQYFQSRGVAPFATSPAYWAQKWNEWGKNDPAYFEQRLAQADEFTGKGPNYDWQAAGQRDPGTSRTSVAVEPGGGYQPLPVGSWPFPPLDYQLTDKPAGANPALQGQQNQNYGISDAMRQALLKLMTDSQAPVDPNDPIIANRTAAYRTARERGAGREREAAAERAAFTGLNSGGQGSGSFDTAIQGINENASQDVAGFGANLQGEELQARRQQLVQALSLANSMGARTEAAQLQMALSELDAQLRREGLVQQQGQFEDTMGLNYNELLARLNRESYLSALEG